MAYRDERPLRSYPLRSSRAAPVVAAALVALATAWTGWLLWQMFSIEPWIGGRLGPLSAVLLWAVAAAYLVSLRNDSVSGGEGEVKLFRTPVEVPRSYGGAPLMFTTDSLALHIQRIEGRAWGLVTISVVEVLHLRGDGQRRALSSRLFGEIEALRELAADLAALKAGLPLPTHEDSPRGQPAPRDAYDDRLDAELDAFD